MKIIKNLVHFKGIDRGRIAFEFLCDESFRKKLKYETHVAAEQAKGARDWTEKLEVVHPGNYDRRGWGYKFFDELMQIQIEAYQLLIDNYEWAEKDARLILGPAIGTRISVKMKTAAWRKLFERTLFTASPLEKEWLDFVSDILTKINVFNDKIFSDLYSELEGARKWQIPTITT
ncbi:MAG TPA: hypothetical protein VNU45_05215 [Rummeliibacillus sp.]|nr:hypothetical protein [Rummeliibacillus sp.]